MSLQTRKKQLNVAVIRLICHCKNSQTWPRGERLIINISRKFGKRLSLRAMRLAAAFTGTSYTILRGSITLREFPVKKARKSLVFSRENRLHF